MTRGDDSSDLLMIIPNSPGGGYDLTGRDAVQVLEDEDITGGSITVENIVGAGGAVAMTELVGQVGDEHTLMTVGLGVVGSTYSFGSQYGLRDATPIAQLMSEPEGILVPGDSPYETLDDFLEAWKADPGSLAVGGGSSPGGPDHLFPMQLAAGGRHRPQRRQLRDLRRRRSAHQRAAREEDRRGLLGPARVPGLHRLRRAAGAGRLR